MEESHNTRNPNWEAIKRPCLEGVDEGTLSTDDIQPIAVLPLEIWEKILKKLSPRDFLAVINASPQWRELLDKQKKVALLPLILPVLDEHRVFKQYWGGFMKMFLSWRSINRSCRRAINSLACGESTSPKKYYDRVTAESTDAANRYTQTNQQNQLILRGRTEMCFEEAVSKFLHHFGGDSLPSPEMREFEHPFLSGAVTLRIENNRRDDEERLNSRRALVVTRFGHHISALTINFCQPMSYNNVEHFCALFHHLPNVKMIRLTGALSTNTRNKRNYILGRLPKLESLELLDLRDSYCCSDRDSDELELGGILVEKYGSQLKALVCREPFLRSGNVLPGHISHLKNLRYFRLEGRLGKSHIDLLTRLNIPFLEDLQLFEKEKCDWKWDAGDQKQGMDFIRMINSFSSSLTHLQLFTLIPWYEGVPSGRDEAEAQMILPKLTKLSTRVFNVTSPWFRDVFLGKCPNLKKICLETPCNEKQRELLVGELLPAFFARSPNLEEIEVYSYAWKKPKSAGLTARKASNWSVMFTRAPVKLAECNPMTDY